MHIENLKIFCDLVESKSFSKAAKTNAVTQSAVSQQLRGIEKSLGVSVVDRAQKQFRLTPEGEIFYRTAKNILDEISQLHSDLQASKNIVAGRLQISTVPSIGLYELPPFLKQFMHAYPAVHTHLDYRRANLVYEDVISGVADFGLIAYPQKNNQVETVQFLEDRLAIICAPEHSLAKTKAMSLKELVGHKLVTFEFDISTRRMLDRYLHEAKVDITPAVEVDDIETMKRAVEIDAGVAIVPLSTIEQEVRLGTLVCIEIKGKPLVRPLALIHRRGRALTSAMRGFIETLTAGKTKSAASR